MKKYAVIVAGGSGSRMGTAVPKQFLLLQGRPVLWYTLNTFLSAYEDLVVVLVVPGSHREAAQAVVAQMGAPERIRVAEGGVTRFDSVRNGLALVEEESVIAVHDGVRCLASVELVRRCFAEAGKMGSAIPVVDCKDSVRWIEGEGSRAMDRSRVKLVQTPQTFLGRLLLPAYRAEYHAGFTDEATVVEAAGHPVHLIEGEVNNIKITLAADLVLAGELISAARGTGG